MIPSGALRCWVGGDDPAIVPDGPGAAWLGAALARRGVALQPSDGPVGIVGWIGAPRASLGPARVRSLRRALARGGRWLLVASEVGDAAWLAPGFERIGGPALGLRARARWDPPGSGGTGRLWPDGRGWFRFGRSLDVLGADPPDGATARSPSLRAVRLAIGRGELTVVADPALLLDDALADLGARAAASRLVEGWLPAPEDLVDAAAPTLGEHPDITAVLADPAISGLLDALDGAGISPDLDVHPDRLPALRALGDRGLAGLVDGRVRLTAGGRGDLGRVGAILAVRAALRRGDLRG